MIHSINSSKFVLEDGKLINGYLTAWQDGEMWAIQSNDTLEVRHVLEFQQVEMINDLYTAALDWVDEASSKGILTDSNMEAQRFGDQLTNAIYRIDYFWDMVAYAKAHRLAKHNFPF